MRDALRSFREIECALSKAARAIDDVHRGTPLVDAFISVDKDDDHTIAAVATDSRSDTAID